jgi:hypothetical protein
MSPFDFENELDENLDNIGTSENLNLSPEDTEIVEARKIDTLINQNLKSVSIQDLHTVFMPHLETFITAFQSILNECNAREIFVELFKKDNDVEVIHQYIAWICAYFIQHELKQKNEKYVKIYFVNSITNFYVSDNDYAFTNDDDWGVYYAKAVQDLQTIEACFQILNFNPISLKGALPSLEKKADDIDYIINLGKYCI